MIRHTQEKVKVENNIAKHNRAEYYTNLITCQQLACFVLRLNTNYPTNKPPCATFLYFRKCTIFLAKNLKCKSKTSVPL